MGLLTSAAKSEKTLLYFLSLKSPLQKVNDGVLVVSSSSRNSEVEAKE